ncbi:unnamed protein product [Parnassius apollo]|uniref:(apollo) hypothetical protein n=1 Tax=Parnassius apollo TaxID=110799 RepID=A0A8S3Y691_PARAO|nr:unnamed protein product [Parnassius apollo]
MIPVRKIILVILLTALTICQGNENWLENLFEVSNAEKRSMSDVIVDFLDYVFPKDDSESSIMKEIFTMFAEDGPPGIQSGLAALEYVIER